MLDDLTGLQLQEWEDYNKIQPIGGKRFDFYYASLLCAIHNLTIAIHGKKGSKKQFTIEEFMPNWTGEKKEQEQEIMTPQQMRQFFASNFKVKSKRK